ncbi:MAG: right-handed parallel beta-helix repeat-containing protein [Candidatus Thermoplasmatota archaeon]|nr:right-handed parallel beta-helix repeat-containing protein [Euryarchaeota archaeon]MBU4031572.1 right-handed parallel beta-helix repeat-containing protein [Candidatus Thermoplasmatota archaeon]MBU4070762.1 right-handed parallel beta-helix repeat-containing protein [Candidatus Thermoplasmatota archaeon]MBU4144754.1 right-handed parallel beta-helix repeat-containing protein [Candidatus Thermoplasmatota archaeon]MBU4591005.1 right-handed parallel beta-helix repeat-containing protein [Candidatus
MADILIYVFAFGFTGILVFSILRFGPVEHGWLNLTPDEMKELMRLNKEAVARRISTKEVPQGNPLYKKSMVSHNGIVVYSNGIMAKFCIARKGKYRFVPFRQITGIYPAVFHNPMAQKDSVLMGPATWKDLQIETDDFMVYIIGSRAHNFETLIPIIKQAMGAQWNAVYKENEVIEGDFTSGQFYRHKYLRGETAPAPAPMSAQPGYPVPPLEFMGPAQTSPPKPISGYGALLAQESQKDIQDRKKTMIKGFIIMLSIGVGMLAFTVLLWGSISTMFMFTPLLFGGLMILLSLVFYNASKKSEPLQIYENGILQPYLVGSTKLFVPYGRIISISETKNFIDGELVVMKTSDNQTIGFRKNSPDVMAQMDMIRSKIRNPAFDFKMQNAAEPAAGGKLEIVILLLAPALALTLALFMAYSALGPDLTFRTYLMGLVLLWPGITFILLTFILIRFRKNARIFGKRPSLKIPVAIVVALLVLFIVGGAYFNTVPSSSGTGTYDIFPVTETAPSSSVLNGAVYNNVNLNIDGSILVNSGQKLEIRNSVLSFQGLQHKDSSIWTAPGSELVLDNCTLNAASSAASYSFEVFGTLRMNNCRVSGVWGDIDNVNLDGGIEIYSPDARISNTSIFSPTTNGIMAINSTLVLENVTIINAFDDALEVRNTVLIANGCTISDNGWAMVLEQGSNATMTDCLVSRSSNGIAAQHSALIIHDCEFTDNSEYAIKYSSMDYVDIGNNVFTGNEMDIEGVESSGSSVLLCNGMTFVMGIICILAAIYAHKGTDNI